MERVIWGSLGLLTVGALSPGPNNFVVMARAAGAGWRGAVPAVGGVIAGSLGLLLVVATAGEWLLRGRPEVAMVIPVVGSLYLAVLGCRWISDGGRRKAHGAASLPAGVWGLALFQLSNPKAWVLCATMVSAARSRLGLAATLAVLTPAFVIVPGTCLSLWAWAGTALTERLRRPRFRRGFDLVMGSLLVLSALALLADAVLGGR